MTPPQAQTSTSSPTPSPPQPQVTLQSKAPAAAISPAIVTGLLLLLLLTANLVVGLLLTNTSQESQVVGSQREALRRNKQNIQQLQADLLAYSGSLSQINSSLPKEENIPEFIQFMTDTASRVDSELALNFTSNQPSVAKDGVAVIPISMQLLTSQANLLKFVEAVHQSQYQVRFEHVEIEVVSGPSHDLKGRILGKLFVSPQFSNPRGKT